METLTMAYTRKKAEQIVTGLEDPLNVHLVKLLALQAPPETRAAWKREVKSWLRRIARIHVKPQDRSLPQADLFAWLYEEPFGGSETRNVEAIARIEGEGFARTSESAEVVSARLKSLHESLSARLSEGDPADDLIDAL